MINYTMELVSRGASSRPGGRRPPDGRQLNRRLIVAGYAKVCRRRPCPELAELLRRKHGGPGPRPGLWAAPEPDQGARSSKSAAWATSLRQVSTSSRRPLGDNFRATTASGGRQAFMPPGWPPWPMTPLR